MLYSANTISAVELLQRNNRDQIRLSAICKLVQSWRFPEIYCSVELVITSTCEISWRTKILENTGAGEKKGALNHDYPELLNMVKYKANKA